MEKEYIKKDENSGGFNKLILSYYYGNDVNVYIEDHVGHFTSISINVRTKLGLCLKECITNAN